MVTYCLFCDRQNRLKEHENQLRLEWLGNERQLMTANDATSQCLIESEAKCAALQASKSWSVARSVLLYHLQAATANGGDSNV